MTAFMVKRTALPLSAAALALMLVATDVSAQFGGTPGGIFGGRSSRGGGSGDSGRRGNAPQRPAQPAENSYDQIEYRLSLLEDDLHLQSQQRGVWDSFADRVRAYAGDLARERARGMTAPAGTAIGGVQHIDHAIDVARNRLTALEDVAAAAKSLYAALTPEQKMLVDSRIANIVEPRPRAGPDAGAYSFDRGSSPPPGTGAGTQR